MYKDLKGNEITAKDGLLWVKGKIVELPEADRLAAIHGFYCAEQLVRAIEEGSGE